MDLKLKGKTALIGGSSKGLGRACALSLAREGVNIVLTARNEDALIQTKKEVELLGVNVLALVANMSCGEDNKRIVQEASRLFGGIDILINNSGGPKPGTFREVSEEDVDDAYESLLKNNIRMIGLCLPYMEEQQWGRIINITSITVKEPAPNLVLSNIFRAAVVSYAKSISKDLIGKGITINNIAPGYFKTDRVIQLMEASARAEGVAVEEYEQRVIAGFPHRRYMNPGELGDTVSFLCSDQARSINGVTIPIDGGLLQGLT